MTQNKNQQRNLDSKNHPEVNGLVISRFGSEADIELDDGEILRCHLRRKLEHLVCGDRVLCRQQGKLQAVVTEILPRRNVLERPIRYQGIKAVAANLDQMIIVISPEPEFSPLILDKYLVVAENAELQPLIVFNKCELLDKYPDIRQQLSIYEALGYPLIFTSVKKNIALQEFEQLLGLHCNVLVGQSGVGKSSLVNALLPHINAEVNQISDNSGLGQHTTTASRLYHLKHQGSLIDSPGIREFSMQHFEPHQLIRGYQEIFQLGKQCKYRDCRHTKEPGCAVKLAVDKQQINPQRYQRYIKILEQN